MFTQLLHARRV